MAEILIIDDDSVVSYTLKRMARQMGHNAVVAASLQAGWECCQGRDYDVVFLDVRLPDGNGLELIPRLKSLPAPPEIIIVTAYGDPLGADLALKSGVWEYVEKPSRLDQMKLTLSRALQYREQKRASKAPVAIDRAGIIGTSQPLTACIDLMTQAAAGEANILITGETGTGKELFAHAIHVNSARAAERFVVVDCAALPEHLVESILFGHAKGAYTGAERSQSGLIRQADGGTLFLDEVGEMPLSIQKAFLRVLQEHRFRPVGAAAEAESEFRLVAATNRDLDQLVRKGQFRSDLLHRLRALSIDLPPLRRHPEDIKELAIFHAARLCEKYGLGPKGLDPEFLQTLKAYDWPGNVRELVNTLESAINLGFYEPMLFPVHLPPRIRARVVRDALREAAGAPAVPSLPTWRAHLAQTQKAYVRRLFAAAGNDLGRAQKLSGLSRATLYNYLKKFPPGGPA